jgi:hypothetical protein
MEEDSGDDPVLIIVSAILMVAFVCLFAGLMYKEHGRVSRARQKQPKPKKAAQQPQQQHPRAAQSE